MDFAEIELKTRNNKLVTEHNMTQDEISIDSYPESLSRLKQLQGQCKIHSFEALKCDYLKTCLLIVPIVVSLVGLLLIKHYKKLRVLAFYKSCLNSEAQYFYIQTKDGNDKIQRVERKDDCVYVDFQNLKYQLRNKELIPVGYQFQRSFNTITNKQYASKGLSNENYEKKLSYYGKNEHKVEIPSYFEYIFEVLTKPFFILQYIICIILIFERFVQFAIINISFSVITTSINYYLLYVSFTKIKDMAQKELDVNVIRNGCALVVKNHDLVPGDIVIPKINDQISFDGILISGEVFVNEASLTGQSIPIGKFPVIDLSSAKKESVWIVQGSKVLQTRQESRIVVINTGYSTRRGRIIRKILTRTSKTPDFYNSAIIFLIETFVVAIIIYFSTLYLLIEGKVNTTFIVFRFLDFLGWSFPPTFPIFFNISYSFSLIRLKWKNIFGTQPQKVTQASNLSTFFFDKTGTLTENQIKVYQIYKFNNKNHENITNSINNDSSNQLIQKLFASCHTVRQIQNSFLGDQVDLRMFLYTEYIISQGQDQNIRFTVSKDDRCVQVLRINQFQSKFQNMSVLVRDKENKKYYVFVKGAPEKIQQNSSVKIPSYYDLVSKLSLGGYRTIGYGYKQITQSEVDKYLKAERQIFEKNIIALGLVAFQNKLKHDTRQTIDKLRQSDIVPKMITGDNIYIAVQTGFRANILSKQQKVVLLEGRKQAQSSERRNFQGILLYKKDSEIIQEDIKFTQQQFQSQTSYSIIIDNDFFNLHPRPYISQQIKIFSRISPQNKANIVKIFKEQEKMSFESKSVRQRWFGQGVRKVGMCGDGANDLMAIRQADVGIGISDSDASYAACFTITQMLDCEEVVRESKNANQSIVDMIRYFGTINFIKIVSSILLLTDVTYYTNNQTTYFNFANSVWLTIAFSLSSSASAPTKKRPICNFLSLNNHLIYWINIALPTLGMCLGYYYFFNTSNYRVNPLKVVTSQKGYQGTLCTTNTIIWLLINFVFIVNAYIIYKGEPFKSSFYKNIPIMILSIVNLAVLIAFFFTTKFLQKSLNLIEINHLQAGVVLAIIAGSTTISLIITKIIDMAYESEDKKD